MNPIHERSRRPLTGSAGAKSSGRGAPVAWACLLMGVVGILWMWRQDRAEPKKPPVPPPVTTGPSLLRATPEMQGGVNRLRGYFGSGGRRGGGSGQWWKDGTLQPARAPRYLANMSGQAGDYIVSIRQVMGNMPEQNLFMNADSHFTRPHLNAIILSVQIMATKRGALNRMRDFAVNLAARDDTGKQLEVLEILGKGAFEKGQVRLVRLSAPSPDANALASLEGDIVLGRPDYRSIARYRRPSGFVPAYGRFSPEPAPEPVRDEEGDNAEEEPDAAIAGKTLRFRIADIPLPTRNHLFAVVSATWLDAKAAARYAAVIPHASTPLPVLASEEAGSLRRRFPPYTQEAGPLDQPTRLALPPGKPTKFLLYTVEDEANRHPLECTITTRPGENGEIPVTLALSRPGSDAPAAQATLRFWENRPGVAILPPSALKGPGRSGRHLAIWMHLFQTMPPSNYVPGLEAPSPFPALRGERGGLMEGAVQVGGKPFGLGVADIEIALLDSSRREDKGPTTVQAPLDRQGRWRFSNLSPGRYRVTLLDARPFFSTLTEIRSSADYLKQRYGIARPAWSDRAQEGVTVRAGGQTALRPWNVHDAGDREEARGSGHQEARR